MVPQLIARVDGLPVSLLERQVVWPAPDGGRGRSGLSPRLRARIERQTAACTSAGCRDGRGRWPSSSRPTRSGSRSAPSWSRRGCCRCAAITAPSGGRRRC